MKRVRIRRLPAILPVLEYLPWIAGCEFVGAIGSMFTVSSISTWYDTLIKPPLRPPNWAFGPVWIVLYALMGISAYRIYRIGASRQNVRQALAVFGVQLFLNAVWSPVFFGVRDISLAFVIIVFLWLAIVVTISQFFQIDRKAAWMLVPYLLWVTFASYLNFEILLLNP